MYIGEDLGNLENVRVGTIILSLINKYTEQYKKRLSKICKKDVLIPL